MKIDKEQIRLWYKLFKDDKDLVEVRVFPKNSKKSSSGYFKSADNIIKELEKLYDESANVYFTLNEINEDCYNKEQREKIVQGVTTTTDEQITKRKWLMLDFDPCRVSGISSTDAQVKEAQLRALSVEKFLSDYGFPRPYRAMSGNGSHLLYKIDLPNTDAIKNIIKHFLGTLGLLFTDRIIDVDTVVFNASRICKVYGTYARKGSNTEETPHRLSKLSKHNDFEIETVSLHDIETVASLLPDDEETKSKWGDGKIEGNGVDVHAFLEKHNIKIVKEEKYQGGSKITIEHCAFNPDHTAPDAVIFISKDGIPNYHCSHNSCKGKNWHAFREKLEPDFYKDRESNRNSYNNRYNNNQQNNYQNKFNNEIKEYKPIEEKEDIGKKWLSLSDIAYPDVDSFESIPTGIESLDRRIVGLYLTEVSILSGTNASGKSSWLNTVAANCIEAGYKVALWSGELVDFRWKGWFNQNVAGKDNITQSTKNENVYYADRKVSEKIELWSKDKIFLYNNEYGSKWKQIEHDLKAMVDKGVALFIIDNLMALDINCFSRDQNENQKQLVLAIKMFAKRNNVHVILVAHPRKTVDFLRKESISGSGDISNTVDNVFIIHRVNSDFQKRAREFLGDGKSAEYAKFSNVIEVAKNRSLGVVDYFVGMYYEEPTRRFLNYEGEYKHYGWESYNPQQSISSLKPSIIAPTGIDDNDPFGGDIEPLPF